MSLSANLTERTTPYWGDAWACHPLSAARHFWAHRELIWQWTTQELRSRVRGTWLGWLWMLATPLAMLVAYTFVFAGVFRAKWGGTAAGNEDYPFALAVFGGISLYQLLSETVHAAPNLVVTQPNLVKRVVFPLEILPLAKTLAALVQASASVTLFVLAACLTQGGPGWSILCMPLVVLPLAIWACGLAFLLSALGVFAKDLGHVVGLLTMLLMFLSPVFFPLSQVPEVWQPVVHWNPLTPILESARSIALAGAYPEWIPLGATTFFGSAFCQWSMRFFARAKPAFADVL